jgi:ABC-type transport system involved in multi-copper enzyme maturation permease subunit
VKQRSISSRFGLPLLVKELIEQAARRRTYVLRVLYASLLFVASCLMFYEILRVGNTSPFAALGRGREMFNMIVWLQFAGIYLFMPAIACGVITQEKERNSLMLLLLTRLGPWSIVFEKLMSRLVPMLCYQLLALPLLAFTYSLGGLTTEYLWTAVLLLGVTALQMGTMALFWSCWSRTTVSAFVGSYLTGLLLILGPWVLWEICLFGEPTSQSPVMRDILSWRIYETEEQVLFPLFAPLQFHNLMGTTDSVLKTSLRSIPILLSSAMFLVLARVAVLKRAFVPPTNHLLNLFKSIDRGFSRLNDNRLTRGLLIAADRAALPDTAPVAWRETTKRTLGQARYLFRVFVAIEAPLGVACLLLAYFGADPRLSGGALMLFLLWIVAVLMVSVHAASLVAGERTHQTLDVLCTTPMSGRDILLQKFRGVRRLILVLLVPFFTLFLFATFWRNSFPTQYGFGYYQRFEPVIYMVCSALSVGIYLPLVAWLSFLIGLKTRSGGRAIIASLGVIVGWCILPIVFVFLPIMILFSGRTGPDDGLVYLLLLSPATIIPVNEFSELMQFSRTPWLAVTLNFLLYGFFLVVIRTICLTNADHLLGRAESR